MTRERHHHIYLASGYLSQVLSSNEFGCLCSLTRSMGSHMTKPVERRDSAPMVEEIFSSISELGSDSRDMALDVEI
jgi:hypothetical protein